MRVVAILLKFTRSTGYFRIHISKHIWQLSEHSGAMSLSEEEIARRIAEVGKEAGLDEQSYHALVAELSK